MRSGVRGSGGIVPFTNRTSASNSGLSSNRAADKRRWNSRTPTRQDSENLRSNSGGMGR